MTEYDREYHTAVNSHMKMYTVTLGKGKGLPQQA